MGKINWTKVWSKKYPVLEQYHSLPDIDKYQKQIEELFNSFEAKYHTNPTDTVLILKDILYQEFNKRRK